MPGRPLGQLTMLLQGIGGTFNNFKFGERGLITQRVGYLKYVRIFGWMNVLARSIHHSISVTMLCVNSFWDFTVFTCFQLSL